MRKEKTLTQSVQKKITAGKLLCMMLITCFLATSCNYPIQYYIYIDQETKDYCLFEEGSYWIYQNSADFMSDTMKVENVMYAKHGMSGGHAGYERYSIYVRISGYTGEISRSFLLSSDETHTEQAAIRAGTAIFLFWFHYPTEFANFYHSGEVGTTSLQYTLDTLFPIYSTDNFVFSNVKRFVNINDNHKCYWAKHVGLIRIEEIQNDVPKVYNLIEYNINPYKN
jgi:hypothetical protein